MIEKDDNELVFEVTQGSISSFGILIQRYQKQVYMMMLRMTGNPEEAKDLTQDVFIKAFEKLGTFNPSYRFFSWIYRIAMNEVISRNRKIQPVTGLENAASIPAGSFGDPEQELRMGMLNEELLKLDPDARMLVLLKYFGDLPYDEIAVVAGISVEKVRSRLFSARKQLRIGLIANGFFEL